MSKFLLAELDLLDDFERLEDLLLFYIKFELCDLDPLDLATPDS